MWLPADLWDFYDIYFQKGGTGPPSFLAAEPASTICVMIWDEFQLLKSCIKMQPPPPPTPPTHLHSAIAAL